MTNANTYCTTGDYQVLVTAFPSYNDPVIINSTVTHPVPTNALPSPATTKYPAYACVVYFSSTFAGNSGCIVYGPIFTSLLYDHQGIDGTMPGALVVDSLSNQYICKVTFPLPAQYRSTTTLQVAAPDYAVVTGNPCL